MKQSAWEKFNWIRMGESGGNREGYSKDVFDNMSPEELSKAKDLLIIDNQNGDVFSLEGLCYASPSDANLAIEIELSNTELTKIQKINLLCLKDFINNHFINSTQVIDYIFSSNERIKSAAITGLRKVSALIKDEEKIRIAEAIVLEQDAATRAKIAELLKLIYKERDDLITLNFECARQQDEEKRRLILIKYNLI
jgi:hypothetical protein